MAAADPPRTEANNRHGPPSVSACEPKAPVAPAPRAPDESAPALLRLGRIGGAHGLTGALRVRPDNPESEALGTLRQLILEHSGVSRGYELREARRLNRTMFRVVLEGVASPEAADALRGAIVMVPANHLPRPAAGEFYYHEIVGCEVVTTTGERVGVVEETFSTGANDVWSVRDGAREVLVPVIEDVVKAIDMVARRVTIESVPGLLD
jgi:16S rRNA processing protein RimM